MTAHMKLKSAWLDLDRFLRLHFIGFATVWCLLGAWSVVDELTLRSAAAALAVAVCFHVYAYVLNDVVDLPVDRTHPDRQQDPLVRGAVRPATALGIALAQIPLGFGLLWLTGASPLAWQALAGAFALMAVYDVWGKRCPVPPLTDLAQGLAWGAMAYVGAGLTTRPPVMLTHVLFAYAAAHILLINGIHGGLRDLANDLQAGRVSTAAFLGARPLPGGIRTGRRVLWFTLSTQALLVGLLLGPLYAGAFGYVATPRAAAIVLATGLSLLMFALAYRVARPELSGWGTAMRVHLFLIPLSLLALLLPLLEGLLAGTVVALYALPGLTLDFTRQLLGRLFSARAPVSGERDRV